MKRSDKQTILAVRVDNPSDVYTYVKKSLDSIGNLNLRPENSVVLKPNLCCIRSYETGATTDPQIVEAIITYLKSEYSIESIYIVESDGSQVLADMAFKLLGYENLSKKLGVQTVNLSKSPGSIRDFPNNAFLKRIRIPNVMEQADFFISVPKIKMHDSISFTSALKNQFGCNPNPHKSRLHKRLDDAIVDLNAVFRPDLVVVDGLIAMGGYRGPVDGVPIRMNTLLVGKDPVAIDHLVARIVGLNPQSIEYLVKAERRGIGTTDYITEGPVPFGFQKEFLIDQPRLLNLYNLFRHRY